jgi:predicted CoA-binding protein
MSEKKKTLVLGASSNPARYSYLAIRRLREHGHPVKAIGMNKSIVEDVMIETVPTISDDIDTVTLYLNPAHQEQYYDYILSLNPKRIIFNPGAENTELEKLANNKGIKTMEACTLVMLGTNQF